MFPILSGQGPVADLPEGGLGYIPNVSEKSGRDGAARDDAPHTAFLDVFVDASVPPAALQGPLQDALVLEGETVEIDDQILDGDVEGTPLLAEAEIDSPRAAHDPEVAQAVIPDARPVRAGALGVQTGPAGGIESVEHDIAPQLLPTQRDRVQPITMPTSVVTPDQGVPLPSVATPLTAQPEGSGRARPEVNDAQPLPLADSRHSGGVVRKGTDQARPDITLPAPSHPRAPQGVETVARDPGQTPVPKADTPSRSMTEGLAPFLPFPTSERPGASVLGPSPHTSRRVAPVGMPVEAPPPGQMTEKSRLTPPDTAHVMPKLTTPENPPAGPGMTRQALGLSDDGVTSLRQPPPKADSGQPAEVRMMPASAPQDAKPAAPANPVFSTGSPTLSEPVVDAARGTPAPDMFMVDQRPGTETSTVLRPALATQPQSPEIPRQIAQQIALAVQGGANNSIELQLNPLELGRVRITLSPSEAGMIVSIVADRAETLDLMRRNADMLAQDFRDIGYGATSFDFGQGAAQHRDAPHDAGDSALNDPDLSVGDLAGLPETAPHAPLPTVSTDRVDIRL